MKNPSQNVPSELPVLVIGNTKGGVGKSLLATSLAAAFAGEGTKVFLIDADVGQSTSQEWVDRRERGRVAGCKSALIDVGRTIASAASKGAGLVIVDLGGRDDAALKPVLEHADLVVIPAQPSLPDLKETNRFIRIARAAGVPWTVVLTRVKREEAARTREYIGQYAALGEIAPVHTGDRVGHQDAYLYAQGATEFAPNSIAAWEINRLRDHIARSLKGAA
jgi:chromosome partitioning protein